MRGIERLIESADPRAVSSVAGLVLSPIDAESINFTRTLQQTQRDFGGASITEPSSRASSAASCPTRARRAPPGWMRSSGSGSIPPSRPAAESTVRSSPVRGLAGPGFYDASGGCIGPPADGAMAAPSASAAIGSGGLDVGDGRVQRGVG